jgi:uncharacterized membrane protein
MASLSQAKTLGGVGSILVILSIIPYAGFVIGIIGWILILLAIKNISDAMQDRAIFNNALISVILAIVGVAVAGVVVAGAFFGFMGLRGTLGSLTPGTLPPSSIMSLIGEIILGLAVVWVVAIISAFFLRKSFNEIATKLNVGMFRTGVLLFFIGAILTIILVGFILIFVAEILFIVAFFGIPETLPTTMGPPPPSMSPGAPPTMSTGMGSGPAAADSNTKFCVKCGASLARDASFCPSCGASQPRM